MFLPKTALRIVYLAFIVSISVAAGGSSSRQGKVTQGDFTKWISLSGELEAGETLTMFAPSTRVWGVTISYLAPEGSTVQPGEVVARFDSSRLEMDRLDLEKTRENARVNIAQKEAEIETRRLDLLLSKVNAQKNVDVAKLYAGIDAALLPRSEAERYRYNLETAQLELAKAEEALGNFDKTSTDDLNVVKLDFKQADFSLKRIQSEVDSMTIKAPTAGIIMIGNNWQNSRPFQVGDRAFEGTPILYIPNLKTLRVNARITDPDVLEIKEGLPAKVTLDAAPDREFDAQVGTMAEAAKNERWRSTMKYFYLKVKLLKPDLTLMKPGMTVRVSIPVTKRNVPQVPRQSIHFDNRGRTYVTRAGQPATNIPVTILDSNDLAAMVSGGLREGDDLVMETLGAATRGGASTEWVAAQKQDLIFTVSGSGVIQAEKSIEIGPPALHQVWEYKIIRMADEGSQVKKGDFLIQFDPSEIAKRLRDEMADLEKAQREIQKTQAANESSLKDMELALEDARAQKGKADQKLYGVREFESSIKVKEAEYEASLQKQRVEIMERKLLALRKTTELSMQILRDKAKFHQERVNNYQQSVAALEVKAPADGVIVYNSTWNGKAKVGSSVYLMQTVMSLPDLTTLKVAGQVAEVDSGKIKAGQPVTVNFDAIQDRVFRGRIQKIARTITQANSDNPLKVLDVLVALDSLEPRRMRPGMASRLEIEVDRFNSVLAVPLSAIQSESNRSFVWVNVQGRPTKREVKIGRNNGVVAVVESGLAPGEKVATRPLG